MLEARLGKLDGVQLAKVRGYDRESKFYFNLQVSENKSVLPRTIRKMLEELKTETKGDEKSGDAWTFVARGSGQKYGLTPSDALKKRVESGKVEATVAGKLTDEQGKLNLEISDAKDPAN